jgi:hypothetical protein
MIDVSTFMACILDQMNIRWRTVELGSRRWSLYLQRCRLDAGREGGLSCPAPCEWRLNSRVALTGGTQMKKTTKLALAGF